MITKELLFLICLHHIAILACEAWRPYRLEFTNVSTSSSADFCQINSSLSNDGSLSVFVNVSRTIPTYYTKAVIKIETSDGIYGLELVNRTVDACKFFNDPTYEPIVQIFYKELTRTGTFPKRCPITKKLYFIKDVVVDPEKLPLTAPFKGLLADITMLTKSGNTLKAVCGYKIQVKLIEAP